MLLHSADKRIARIKFSKVYNFRNLHLPFDLMILLFLCLVNIQAQEIHPIIHPALQVVLSKTLIGEKVDVYASLKDRYPMEELKQQISLFSKKEKRKKL